MKTKKSIERRKFLTEMLKKEYVEGASLRELSKKHNACRRILTSILTEIKVPIVNRYHSIKLKYEFDKINSCEAAYWLGFIYADGSITYTPDKKCIRYCLEIGLAIRDEEHIIKFIDFIGSHKKIEYRSKTKSCRVTVSSKKLITNLYHLGILKNKTYNDNMTQLLKSVPDEFYKDFLRGVFDGDGNIDKNRIGLTSYFPKTPIKLLKKWNEEITYKVYVKDKTKSPTATVYIRKKESQKFLNFIYKDATIYLNRKYKEYEKLWQLPF